MVITGSGAVAAYLAACGGDDDDDKPGGSASPGNNSGGSANAEAGLAGLIAGKAGGKLRVGVTLETGTLDPHVPLSGGDAPYLNLFFNGLVGNDKLNPEPTASLAEKWEVVDPQTIVFTLREGVKFHDGTDFNAEAVKFNVERIQTPDLKATWASQLSAIERVETPDPRTARFILKQPDAPLIFNMSSVYGAGMISPAALEKHGTNFKTNPVGTGPFVFSEWIPGDHVTGKRNPNYWEKDKAGAALPYLDEVTITPIPDDTVRYANLQTNEVQVAGIASKDIAQAEQNKDLFIQKGVPGAGVVALLHMNIGIGPLDNADLRKAVAFAIDPSVIAKNVYFDLAVQDEASLITPNSWGYSVIDDRPRYNVDKAKEFLRAGGKPDGFEMEVIAYSAPTIQQQTEVYLEQWAKIGIKARVTTQDVSTAVTTFFGPGEQTFPLMSTSWGGTSVEPAVPAGIAYAKDAFYNPSHKAIDPRMDDLIAKARQTYVLEERKALYKQLDEINLVDQCYFIPLLLSQPRYSYRKDIGNAESSYYYAFNRFTNTFFKS